METKHIKTIFENYISEDKTQYAILLNGNWGSGKTYYWKNELSKIAINNKFEPIYISLNGISDVKSLKQSLFYKLIPYVKDNKYLKKLIQLANKFISSDLNDTVTGMGLETFNFNKYVICFDDLERCQIPIKETLGFINNYTEHQFLKTIILADENNLDTSQKGYDNIKEKVIGRILNFELNIDEAVSLLINKYKNNKTIKFSVFLQKYKNSISKVFIDNKQNNLRIISYYLSVLETLFPIIKDIEETYIEEIIFFSALISIEFKNGYLKSNEYKNPKGIQHIDKHYPHLFDLNNKIGKSIINEEKEEKPKSYSKKFYDKYLTERINDYYFFSSIFTFILTGYLSDNMLKLELENKRPKIISKQTDSYRKLINYNFRHLSNIEFKSLVSKVIEYSSNGDYYLYDYVQIANFFYFFSENELIDLKIEEIEDFITIGIEKSKIRKEINDTTLSNLLHFRGSERIEKLKSKIKEIHNNIKKEQNIVFANILIELLNNEDEQPLLEYFADNNFSKEIFQNIDTNLLCKTIIDLPNKRISIFKDLIHNRYIPIGGIGNILYEDYETLKELEKYIMLQLKNENEQPKKFLLNELQITLNKICKHLNNSRMFK